jgi:hypothetical protein
MILVSVAAAGADWQASCVPSRFSRRDGELVGIDVQLTLDVATTDEITWAQLDTAVPQALRLEGRALHGRIAPQPGRRVADHVATAIIGGRLGTFVFPAQDVLVAEDEGARGGRLGVVGTAAFLGSVLVLDLAGERVCVLREPDPALDDGCYTRMWLEEGRPHVSVDGLGRALVDTGSAPQGLWVSAATFEALTGSPHDAAGIEVLRGKAFTRSVSIHRAPALQPQRAGGLPLGRVSVSHVPERPEIPRAGSAAVLGLQPFGSGLVVLDFQRGRLGGPCGGQ